MTDASDRFRGKQVTPRRFKKLQHGFVVPLWRVRDVNDDLSVFECFSQSLAGKDVDARGRRRRHYLMATLPKIVHQLCSDEASASDNHDLHFVTPVRLL